MQRSPRRQIRQHAATRHQTVGAVLHQHVREGCVRHDAEGHYGLVAGHSGFTAPDAAAVTAPLAWAFEAESPSGTAPADRQAIAAGAIEGPQRSAAATSQLDAPTAVPHPAGTSSKRPASPGNPRACRAKQSGKPAVSQCARQQSFACPACRARGPPWSSSRPCSRGSARPLELLARSAWRVGRRRRGRGVPGHAPCHS